MMYSVFLRTRTTPCTFLTLTNNIAASTLHTKQNKTTNCHFLMVYLQNHTGHFVTSTYHKSTYTGLLMNFFSFTPPSYKTGLIRTLVDRARKLNNTENVFQQDLQKLIFTLQKKRVFFFFYSQHNTTLSRQSHKQWLAKLYNEHKQWTTIERQTLFQTTYTRWFFLQNLHNL